MCRGPSCNALQGGRCRSRAFSTWGAAANAPCAVRAAVGSCPTATSRRVPMRSVRRACRWSGTGCWLYLTRETDLLRRPQRILHIAPEVCLMKRLRHRAADYTTADLESPLAELHFDVLRIPLPDASYDVLICNHLLEHVADDRRALGEFYRILRPGGWGILLSPVDRSRAATFEDDSITDPEERTRIFGQYDHRRIYGRDYGGRLREAGFEVREIDYAARFSAEERRRYALPDDWIYVVRRPL